MGVNKLIAAYLKMKKVTVAEAAKVADISYTTLNTIVKKPDSSPSLGVLAKFKYAYPGFNENDENLLERLKNYEGKKTANVQDGHKFDNPLQEYMQRVIDLQDKMMNKDNDYRIKFEFNPQNTFTWQAS